MRVDEQETEGQRDRNLSWHEKNTPLLILKRKIARAFEASGDHATAEKLTRCGEWETLVCCGACGGYWWTRYRCKLRCCPICSRNKARDRKTYLLAIARGQKQCKMITLTMRRWKGNPQEGIKTLRAALQRFRDSKPMKKCKGGAYTIEVLPKDDGWHIHAHLIVDMTFLPFTVLLRTWAACLRQPCPHVRIQSAKDDKVKEYICKYASKSMVKDVGPAKIVEWYRAIQGTRLWATFGLWYNAKLEDMTDNCETTKISMPCPICGQYKTAFNARAGPAIMGRDWRSFVHGELASGICERELPEVIAYVNSMEG